MNYMMKTKRPESVEDLFTSVTYNREYGDPFYCHACGEQAMFMDKDKKWWCYFNWKTNKEHHGICKNNKSS